MLFGEFTGLLFLTALVYLLVNFFQRDYSIAFHHLLAKLIINLYVNVDMA